MFVYQTQPEHNSFMRFRFWKTIIQSGRWLVNTTDWNVWVKSVKTVEGISNQNKEDDQEHNVRTSAEQQKSSNISMKKWRLPDAKTQKVESVELRILPDDKA